MRHPKSRAWHIAMIRTYGVRSDTLQDCSAQPWMASSLEQLCSTRKKLRELQNRPLAVILHKPTSWIPSIVCGHSIIHIIIRPAMPQCPIWWAFGGKSFRNRRSQIKTIFQQKSTPSLLANSILSLLAVNYYILLSSDTVLWQLTKTPIYLDVPPC